MKQKNPTTVLGRFNQDKVDKMVEKYPMYRIGDTLAMLGLLITMDMWLKIWMKQLPPMAPLLLEAWNPVRIDWVDRGLIDFTRTNALDEPIHPEADDLDVKVRKMLRFITGANGGERMLIGRSNRFPDIIGFQYLHGDWYVFQHDSMGRGMIEYIYTTHCNVYAPQYVSPYASLDEALEELIKYIRPASNDFISEINKVTK